MRDQNYPLVIEIEGKNYSICLGKRQLAVFSLLCERAGEVLTRDELLARIDPEVTLVDRSIDSTVMRIRRKLKTLPEGAPSIESVYGRGYRLLGFAGFKIGDSLVKRLS